ncbi:MAG TPA: hypothetical protein VLZ77_14165 [Acidimicrobiales bacterium]|nr:hypothetical protein [Acidimicrobiales bacterium]
MSQAISRTMRSRAQSARLDRLADDLRGAVVHAVQATDLDAKMRWWRSYRSARRAALSMLEDEGREGDGTEVLEAASR